MGIHGHHQAPTGKSHYDHRREKGDHHATALRHLFNRLIGQLHCLNTDQLYDQTQGIRRCSTDNHLTVRTIGGLFKAHHGPHRGHPTAPLKYGDPRNHC